MPANPSRWLVVAAAVAAVAVGVAGVVGAAVVLSDDDAPEVTARTMVQRARAFVDHAETVRFRGDGRLELSDPGGDDSQSFVQRLDIEGEGVIGDRHRVVQDLGDVAYEELVVGDAVYIRQADDVDQLEDEAWGRFDEGTMPGGVVVPGGEPSVAAAEVLTPAGLGQVLEHVTDVTGRAHDDGTWTLRLGTDADDLFTRLEDDFGVDVDDVDVDLTVDEIGRPSRYRVLVTGDGLDGNLDYRMTWGGPVRLDEPDEADLDPTPFIDEDDIAAYDGAPVLVLGEVPAGWILDSGFLLAPDETVEGCEQVELDYYDPQSDVDGYLSLYIVPTSCADPAAPEGATPIDVPGGAGWVVEAEAGTLAQVTIGDTTVQADTDLPADALVRLLASLRPFDPETFLTPTEVPGLDEGLTG